MNYPNTSKKSLWVLFFIFLFSGQQLLSQEVIQLKGKVLDSSGNPIPLVNIAIKGTPSGTVSQDDGSYQLPIPAGKTVDVVFSIIGYSPKIIAIQPGSSPVRQLTVVLHPSVTDLKEFEIVERKELNTNITRLNPKLAKLLPSAGGGIETMIKTLPGVSSSNELSSQYSVRGGNFDENLVYVNGIEIYRPFLIRSGQQEGLSFINSDLVEAITFSAGGFDAKYGDKMSSVLDIRYKTPVAYVASASMSLLGGSLHAEGISKNKKNSFLFGVRQKSHQYLLGTLDTKGDYKPSFTDIQGMTNHRLNSQWSLMFLGNYSRNNYVFIPETRETKFGLATEARQFTVYFEGQESDRYITSMGAISSIYRPNDDAEFSLTASAYQAMESETFDILAQYWLQRLGTNMGEDDFGKPVGDALGVGTHLTHARNFLNAFVANLEQKGSFLYQNHKVSYGIKFQHEIINDQLKEWTMMDSAGYSVPRNPHNQIILYDQARAEINLNSNRLFAFIQDNWEWETAYFRYVFTAGLRTNYWDYNQKWNVSPRTTLLFKPQQNPDWAFRISGGIYHQPPFYRELRDFQGNLNPDIQSQVSYHAVAGAEYTFIAWSRPFKFSNEIYYKHLRNLIPYEINDMRIRYHAFDRANGYAAGLDMKINGEFVKGVESWASLSLMTTREDIIGDSYVDAQGNTIYPGYIPRPTDQRFNFSIFFQDYLPRNPSYKVHLGFYYGSRLPFGPPNTPKHKHTFRIPPYRRADIGFSKLLKSSERQFPQGHVFHHLKTAWITAEVFNLLEINNTASYLWIRELETNYQYAIPNYLTSRLINVKISIEL